MCAKLRIVREDDPEEPFDRYIEEVKGGTTNTLPYERLMIWYRKEKKYAEEIKVIIKGIKRLKKMFADQQKQVPGRKISSSIKELSDKINKTTGLHDKKGNQLFLPDPLPKWIKRQEVAEEKLRKQKAKPIKKKTKK